MSFILDALRKSEHERRLETAPDIMHAPVAVPRQRLPAWTIVLMASLAAALVAVTAYSFLQRRSVQTTNDAVRTAPLPVVEQTSVPARTQAATIAVTAPSVQQPEPAATAAPATSALDTAATQSATGAPVEIDVPASAVTQTSAPLSVRASDTSGLPTYAQAIADGLSVSALQMQLHVHSSSPASRFVVINGNRLREGERVAGGSLVEEIVAEGAVLSYQGRQFLLTPN